MTEGKNLRACTVKPRVFVISDISNEPDDAQSLIRFLLYSNELETEGLVACTSTHMRNNVHPEDMQRILKAYATVVNNLNAHVHPSNPYPSAAHLLSLVTTGPAVYGQLALSPDVPLSPGAQLLVDRLDSSDEPLWVLCWGGTNVLAQALLHAQKSRSEYYFQRLRSKIRVYAINDQDDTGEWIRVKYPDIFYICSLHGWNEYRLAT
ncbi:hypothetical protein N7540_004349 [Penicillium herquei]|nr:hypothetical protein N7540_004349 [Penicillium herquei]